MSDNHIYRTLASWVLSTFLEGSDYRGIVSDRHQQCDPPLSITIISTLLTIFSLSQKKKVLKYLEEHLGVLISHTSSSVQSLASGSDIM